jgi:hypothetical protein
MVTRDALAPNRTNSSPARLNSADDTARSSALLPRLLGPVTAVKPSTVSVLSAML